MVGLSSAQAAGATHPCNKILVVKGMSGERMLWPCVAGRHPLRSPSQVRFFRDVMGQAKRQALDRCLQPCSCCSTHTSSRFERFLTTMQHNAPPSSWLCSTTLPQLTIQRVAQMHQGTRGPHSRRCSCSNCTQRAVDTSVELCMPGELPHLWRPARTECSSE